VDWAPAQIGTPNLHVQYKHSGAGTRAYFKLPDYSFIEYPEVYRFSKPDGTFHAFCVMFSYPDFEKPQFTQKPLTTPQQVPFKDINSVCWEEKDLCVEQSDSGLSGVQRESLISVLYDYTSFDPVRGKFSF
jgi:hypothetical protein